MPVTETLKSDELETTLLPVKFTRAVEPLVVVEELPDDEESDPPVEPDVLPDVEPEADPLEEESEPDVLPEVEPDVVPPEESEPDVEPVSTDELEEPVATEALEFLDLCRLPVLQLHRTLQGLQFQEEYQQHSYL